MSTIDMIEMTIINVASITLIAIPAQISLMPEIASNIEFGLKVIVGVTLAAANIAKYLESKNRNKREQQTHDKNHGADKG